MSDETVHVPAALVEDLRRAMRYVDVKDSLLAREDQEDAFKCARAVVDAAERPDEGEPQPTSEEIVEELARQLQSSGRMLPHWSTLTEEGKETWRRIARDRIACSAPQGEPLCTCGHGREAHIGEHTNCRMQEVSPYVHICPCWKFTPAPLSSPRRTRDDTEAVTLTDQIAELLSQHRECWNEDGAKHEGCSCDDGLPSGWREMGWMEMSVWYRAHVASVLADLMAERQAEAWDEGVGYMAERCVDEHGVSANYRLSDNPNRVKLPASRRPCTPMEKSLVDEIEKLRADRASSAQRAINELRKFLPEWGYPAHVVSAICLELKARMGEPR